MQILCTLINTITSILQPQMLDNKLLPTHNHHHHHPPRSRMAPTNPNHHRYHHRQRKTTFRNFIFLSLSLITLSTTITSLITHFQKITYFLRPIWDTPPPPFYHIPHYYAENVSLNQLCRLHNWTLRQAPRRVFDAIIFSNELDLLEIRWRELLPLVTKFIILESITTFTGIPKPLFFQENRARFSFAEGKIIHGTIPGKKPKLGRFQDNPFEFEAQHRLEMNNLLKISGISDGDLLIIADTDEIPSYQSVRLFQWCEEIPFMHLQLRNYIYSFEFLDGDTSKSSVQIFDKSRTVYRHSHQSRVIFSDAGWHCSFCFKNLGGFVFKMKAYSHADRVKREDFLDFERIQRIICEGGNLYDMLPEEYTFRDLIKRMGNVPKSTSGVLLPGYLIENADRFRFLLPGGCLRQP